MKPLLLTSLLLVALPVMAADPNPFMSAEDRQEKLQEEKQKEDAKFQKLLESAVKEIKKEMNSPSQTNIEDSMNEITRETDGIELPPTPANRAERAVSDPSDFAIAAIKGRHILIRQMDNKSFIVGTGQIFWDQGESYDATLNNHESVTIRRLSDDRIVFYGGVGSVFSPKTQTSGNQSSRDRSQSGMSPGDMQP